MTNAEFWLIALASVLASGSLAFIVGMVASHCRFMRRHRQQMAEIKAGKGAILAEHAAWIANTTAMLDGCVEDGLFTEAQATRYRRFVR